MVFTIGIDIEEIHRFSQNIFEQKKTFYEKIFTPNEIEYCLSKKNPYPHFAARFCAKEAAFKALDDNKIKFLDIEVFMRNQKPMLNLPSEKKGLLSLSHTEKLATAFVIIF